jgi:trk system potassium uptake protein TrkA
MKQQVAVIGLGRFGSAVAEELVRLGHEVLGIDSNLAVVQQLSTHLSHVVQADAVDEETLHRLGIRDFDAAIVAVTENLETSILATMVLKRMGVKRVVAKARNDLHGEILTRVGADRVVFPERDTGLRLAHSWSSLDITDSLDIVEGYIVSRVLVPDELYGKTIGEALGEGTRSPTLLLLARASRVTVYPSLQEKLQHGDVLVVAGQIDQIGDFFARVSPDQD